jgi:hypothetical protein
MSIFKSKVNYSPYTFGNVTLKKEMMYTLIAVAKTTGQATIPTPSS